MTNSIDEFIATLPVDTDVASDRTYFALKSSLRKYGGYGMRGIGSADRQAVILGNGGAITFYRNGIESLREEVDSQSGVEIVRVILKAA